MGIYLIFWARFQTVLFELTWFNELFDASLVSRFVFNAANLSVC